MSDKGRTRAPPSPAARRSKAVRWALGVGAAAFTGIGLVLMFMLAQATNNRALYERNYARLFGINVVVAVVLALVIGWVAFRLIQRLRQGKFGSRLLIRLAAIFALGRLQVFEDIDARLQRKLDLVAFAPIARDLQNGGTG